jgi:hypothetical protein
MPSKASSLRLMVLAATAAVLVMPALPLILATEATAQVVKHTAEELAKLEQPDRGVGVSLQAYNECVSRRLAARAKSPACKPGDSGCLQEQSVLSCERPTEFKHMAKADVASALIAGGQVLRHARALLAGRQKLALAQVSQAVQGYVVSLGLTLLFAIAAAISALSLSRTSGGDERHLKAGAALLAVVAAVAAIAAVTGVAQIGAPSWDHRALAASVGMTQGGAGVAALAALIAGVGAFYARKAFVARQPDDEPGDEPGDELDDEPDDAD